MSYPKFPDKYSHASTFSAKDLVADNPRLKGVHFPEKVVICFQKHPFQYLVRQYRGKTLPVAFGELFTLRKAGENIGVVGKFGIGAPISVFILEWLAAAGTKEFIVTGFAGGLLETQQPGDLVVSNGALRDEGTSYHYLPPSDYASPEPQLTARLSAALTALGADYVQGPGWTTDAPFRETLAEIEHYRNSGLLTIDMEAAALFAAAEYLNVACAAAFAIGDTPKKGRWQTRFDRARLNAGLETLATAAVHTFSI